MRAFRTKGKERKHLDIENYSFERVSHCISSYLGSLLNEENRVSKKIKTRIRKGSKAYFANKKVPDSKLSFKILECVYNSIIKPVITYGSETWTLIKKNEVDLGSHEF